MRSTHFGNVCRVVYPKYAHCQPEAAGLSVSPHLGNTVAVQQIARVLMPFAWPRIALKNHAHPQYISLKLHDVSQLFNSMDPSPFVEKDLDHDAEEFIVSWAQEFAPGAPIRLRVYLDQWPAEDPKELIQTAVHNYFDYRASIADLEFKRLMRQGRTSLFIGLVFLSACLFLSKELVGHQADTWAAVVRESLTIGGWVAMWKPMQIYLYDWWPLRRRSRIYQTLAHMPVEVIGKAKS